MKRTFSFSLLAALAIAAAGIGSAQAQTRYYDDGYSRGADRVVRCESRDGRTTRCRLDTRGGVRLVRQFSDRACIRGQTWGVRGNSVWVSRGCRGRFAASPYGDNRYYGYDDRNDRNYDRDYDDRGSRYGRDGRDDRDDRYDRYDGRYGNRGSSRVIRCESRDGRYNFCRTSGYADRAQIRRVLSDARCRLNYSWGYRNGGVWVDNGCRAEFVVY
jgi:hypothetical protein